MICPACNSQETKVIDSRVVESDKSVRRRRECLRCGFRFSTYEQMVVLDLEVIKRNGETEPYDRQKILRGLRRAFIKRPISREQLFRLVNDIEVEVKKKNKQLIPTKIIGDIVLEKIRKIDEVAYVRFASVYRKFEDVASFEKELAKLARRNRAQEIEEKSDKKKVVAGAR